jgi:hypothetical protein
MDGFLNEVQIRGSAREQVPPMLQLAEHDKHTVHDDVLVVLLHFAIYKRSNTSKSPKV